MPRCTMYAIYDCCSSSNDASQQLRVVEVLLRLYLPTYKPKLLNYGSETESPRKNLVKSSDIE